MKILQVDENIISWQWYYELMEALQAGENW